MKLFGIEITDKEADYLFCEQAKGKEIKVVDGKVVAVERVITEEEKAKIRISELKSLLSKTDYKAIQFAEGEITEEVFLPIKIERRNWRTEINLLQQEYGIED